MLLRVTFVRWDGNTDTMPNAIAVTDSYMQDSWAGRIPDFYTEAVKELGEGEETREMLVKIPDSAVEALFATPVVEGTV